MNSWPRFLLSWGFLVLCPALLLCSPAFARKNKNQKLPKISVQTRLVKLTVVVRGKRGEPVTDLTKKDFSVFDDGHRQVISLFMSPEKPLPPVQPAQLPPDTYTNLVRANSGTPPSVTIILFDLLNTPIDNQSYARGQLIKYLSQIQPQDHVALYSLGSTLTVVHDFTNNAAELLAALKLVQSGKEVFQYHPAQGAPLPTPGGSSGVAAAMAQAAAVANQFNQVVNAANQAHFTMLQVEKTLQAFNWIAQRVRGLPGRKNLIWLSGGFPFCFCFSNGNPLLSPLEQYYRSPIEQAAQRLEDAGIAVYPVDARGLLGVDLSLIGSQGMVPPNSNLSTGWNIFETMDSLANWTGGVAFYNTNDIMHSIQRAVHDANASYVLGYYPAHHKWKGEFRKISVKLDRKGLTARTRKGYFAVPENSQKPKSLGDIFLDAARSPFDEAGIPMAVSVEPVSSDFIPHIDLSIRFSAKSIRFQMVKGKRVADVQYGLFQTDIAGEILDQLVRAMDMNVFGDVYSQALKRSLGFTTRVPIQTGATTLIVILRDPATGILGSVRIPLREYVPKASH